MKVNYKFSLYRFVFLTNHLECVCLRYSAYGYTLLTIHKLYELLPDEQKWSDIEVKTNLKTIHMYMLLEFSFSPSLEIFFFRTFC